MVFFITEINFELEKAIELASSFEFQKAEAILRRYNNESPELLEDRHKEALAICIYTNHIEDGEDLEVMEQAGAEIVGLIKQKDCSLNEKECYVSKTVLAITDILKTNDPDKSLFWLRFLKPEWLSDEDSVARNGSLYESKKEKYYLNLTKSQLQAKKYKQCIESCNEGLINIKIFRNKTVFHLKYRIAKSNRILENYGEAIKYLLEIRNGKDWFVDHEIATNYYNLGDYDDALKYALIAALTGKNIFSKKFLYLLMSEIFSFKDMYEESDDIDDLFILIDSHFDTPEEKNKKLDEKESELRKRWIEILEDLQV